MLNPINHVEIAWMAAIFEGEGYVQKPKPRSGGLNNNSGLKIKIKMCDRDVLERFQRYAGCGCVSGPFSAMREGWKQTHEYTVQGPLAYALLVSFWGWLGVRRRDQIADAIRAWASMKPTKLGRSLTLEQAREIKEKLANGKRGIGKQLAAEYGVTGGMIHHIKHGRSWSKQFI